MRSTVLVLAVREAESQLRTTERVYVKRPKTDLKV